MTSPFDPLAATYAEQWSNAPHGRSQREQVWREIEGLFAPGSHVLDIGCGIGDDALHLMQQGVRVSGIDTSAQMVSLARARGVEASWRPLDALTASFDGAISNFGVFNCIPDWPLAAGQLATLLRPHAPFALCVMPRFRPTEPRRWRGHTTWRGLGVYYHSRFATRRLFDPHFALQRTISIGRGDHLLFLFQRATS